MNTLDAYAETVKPGSYLICPVLDARKKEVYTALFNSNNYLYQRKTPDQAITPEKLCGQISQPTVFVGNGLEVYKNKAQCGVCHTLEAAGSEGQIGPNLDQLNAQIPQIIYSVVNGIGVMPAWEGILTKEEIEAVAYYIFNSTN